jgi:hypothetical protein
MADRAFLTDFSLIIPDHTHSAIGVIFLCGVAPAHPQGDSSFWLLDSKEVLDALEENGRDSKEHSVLRGCWMHSWGLT